jgi:UDP-glucose 4-epimerase
MDENGPFNPLTPYCIGKKSSEELLAYYGRSFGLEWIALRFFNVYGPGQKLTAYYTSVINTFILRIRRGEAPVIDGSGDQSMDFIHVRDVANAVIKSLAAKTHSCAINVGSGVSTTISELAKMLIKLLGSQMEPKFNNRKVLVSRRQADIRLAKQVLDWSPMVSLESGMMELINDIE